MRAIKVSLLTSLAIPIALIACSSGSSNNNLTGTVPGTEVSSDAPQPVQMYACQKCHGTDMSGVTVELPGFGSDVHLYPPNLTPDMDTGIAKWTDGQLELAIRNGIDNNGEVLCTQMRHFKDITEPDMTATIAWLRARKPVKKVVPGSICPPLKTAPGM